MDEINEGTTAILTVAFTDENSAAVTPDTATYMLYDKFSGTVIIAETSIGSLDTSIDIEISAANNEIIDQSMRYELKTVYLEFTYDGRQGSAEYTYKVLNLAKIPSS